VNSASDSVFHTTRTDAKGRFALDSLRAGRYSISVEHAFTDSIGLDVPSRIVAIAGNQVTITAEVKQHREKKEGERMLRNERYFGNIYRSFTLPVDLEEAACEATYENGILELKLAAKAAAPGKRLIIR